MDRTPGASPKKLIIALTNRCDAGCTFCYRREHTHPVFLSPWAFTRLVDELGPGLERLRFAGVGEPLLHVGFPALVHYVRRCFPRVKLELTSNASRLNEWLVEYVREFDRLWLSVNAATPETKRRVMPGLDHERVVQNVRRAVALDGPTVRVSFLATRDNWQEAEAFVDLARGWGVDRITIQALDRALNDTVWQEQQPPRPEFEPVLARLRAQPDVEVPPLEAFYPGGGCSAGPVQCGNVSENFGLFFTSGEVVFCCYMAAEVERWSVGNIYEQGALDIWHGERAQAFRAALASDQPPDICRRCNNYWSRSCTPSY